MANAAIKYIDEEQEQYLAAREYFGGELHSIITESIGMVSESEENLIDEYIISGNKDKLGDLVLNISRKYVIACAKTCQNR